MIENIYTNAIREKEKWDLTAIYTFRLDFLRH